jgi:hypothetical protein
VRLISSAARISRLFRHLVASNKNNCGGLNVSLNANYSKAKTKQPPASVSRNDHYVIKVSGP